MDASSAPCSHRRQHHMVTNGVTNAVPATAWRLAVVVALLSAAPVSDVEATGVPTTLRVELTDLSGLNPRVVAGLRKEVEQLWATQYRVDWTERSLQCVNPITESPLFVTVLAGPVTGIGKDVIATIRFVDGRPINHVHVYASHAQAFVDKWLGSSRGYDRWPLAARQDALGRVIGRALAHEIGHFVLRSTGHARRGLMKARHEAHALAGWQRAGFELDEASSALLATTTDAVAF